VQKMMQENYFLILAPRFELQTYKAERQGTINYATATTTFQKLFKSKPKITLILKIA
jgi:hypothetical protein